VATLARGASVRSRPLLAGAGAALALAAAAVAPSSQLLPAPHGTGETLLAAVVLALAFAAGLRWPVESFYGLITLTVLEGAIRKWIVNNIAVFLLKDFLLLGVYAAVLPRLRRDQLRRPWWILAPLVGIVVLALVLAPRSNGLSQVAIGLRSYVIYLPLIWVAPALLTTRRRVLGFLALVASLAIVEAVLAVVQALVGPGVLNKLVSGAQAGLITFNGVAYLRPSGTFMQVGVLAGFLFFGLLASFALLTYLRRGRLFVLALLVPGFLTGGLVYSSARTLLGSALLAGVVLGVVLLVRRRVFTLAAVVASFAIGFVVVLFAVPWVIDRIHGLTQTAHLVGGPLVGSPLVGGHVVGGHVVGGRVVGASVVGASVAGASVVGGHVVGARVVGGHVVGARVVGASVVGARVVGARVVGGPVVGARVVGARIVGGRVVGGHVVGGHVVGGHKVGVHSVSTGYLGRAADFNTAGGKVGLWSSRIKPQLELIRRQRLVGHGPGTMTLGAEYANPKQAFQGEGSYSKVAWELGLPGFILFLWLVCALAVATVRGAIHSTDFARPVALSGAGAALILPIWYLFEFALDFPIVGILFWTLVGCAIAVEAGTSPRFANASRKAGLGHVPAGADAI
jgi:hypothetical protein